MKYLSQRQAGRCEQARERVCHCRCQGRLHGARRIPEGGDFSLLAEDDPHYRPSLTPAEAIAALHHADVAVVGRHDMSSNAWFQARHILHQASEQVKQAMAAG